MHLLNRNDTVTYRTSHICSGSGIGRTADILYACTKTKLKRETREPAQGKELTKKTYLSLVFVYDKTILTRNLNTNL